MSEVLTLPSLKTVPLGKKLEYERLDQHIPELAYELGGRAIFLVRADFNDAGTFKIRGAMRGAEQAKRLGAPALSTLSAGNHAIGLMLAGIRLGMPVSLTVPGSAPPSKSVDLPNIWEHFGGNPHDLQLEIVGKDFAEALEYVDTERLGFVHPFNNQAVIEGQGTVLTDVIRTIPGVTHTVAASGGAGLGAGMQRANALFYNGRYNIHPVEVDGSNSLSQTMRQGLFEPQRATNPDARFGGVAVEYVGDVPVDILFKSRFDHRNIVTAYSDGILELAEMYERHTPNAPLEPTALIAVDGLRRLVRNNKLPENAVVAVIATGHNEPYQNLLKPSTKRNKILGSFTGFERKVQPVDYVK